MRQTGDEKPAIRYNCRFVVTTLFVVVNGNGLRND